MAVAITVMVLVLLAMVGSLWWLLPSPSERRRMKLRQLAFSHGMKVREARDEMAEWKIDAVEQGMLMEYYLFREDAKNDQWRIPNPNHLRPEIDSGNSENAPLQAAQHIDWSKLPGDILLWHRDHQKYGFYWFEQGNEEQLRAAIETLKQVRQY